jgi:hypothetical protein
VFEIENLDKVAHVVSIPIVEFQPSKKKEHGNDATPDPLEIPKTDTITVPAGGKGKLEFTAKNVKHFKFDERKPWMDDEHKKDPELSRGMTYKYTVHSRPLDRNALTPLDPDIEINRP